MNHTKTESLTQPRPYVAPVMCAITAHVENGFAASSSFDLEDWETDGEDYGGEAE